MAPDNINLLGGHDALIMGSTKNNCTQSKGRMTSKTSTLIKAALGLAFFSFLALAWYRWGLSEFFDARAHRGAPGRSGPSPRSSTWPSWRPPPSSSPSRGPRVRDRRCDLRARPRHRLRRRRLRGRGAHRISHRPVFGEGFRRVAGGQAGRHLLRVLRGAPGEDRFLFASPAPDLL